MPLPFIVSSDFTWDTGGEDDQDYRVSISYGGNEQALRKRIATMQLCIRPEVGPGQAQMSAVLIFRGKGKRISLTETALYDPRVKILWQEKVCLRK